MKRSERVVVAHAREISAADGAVHAPTAAAIEVCGVRAEMPRNPQQSRANTEQVLNRGGNAADLGA